MNDFEAGTSAAAVTEDFDVFLNHRGQDVKAKFIAHLEVALRDAGFRPFLDVRSLMKGDAALKSIDQALDMAKVHVAVVSRGYAESKYCLNELVAMMRSGKPVIPVFYDVEPVDLRWIENGPFAEAFERHKLKGRTEKRVQEWRDALAALAEVTGFRLTEFKSDEAKLKREVVNEVARRTPCNHPIEVKPFRVGLEGPTNSCIQTLENMGAGVGLLGVVGMGGVGKTTLAREIYNHFAAEKKFMRMTFLEIRRDPSSSVVHVSPKLRKQLLWDLFRVQDNNSSYNSWFQKVSTLGPIFIVIDGVDKLDEFEALVPFTSSLPPGSRIIVTSRDRSILNIVAWRMNTHHQLYVVSTLHRDESNMLFNWHAFHAKEAPQDYQDIAKDVVEACGGLPLALEVIGSSLSDKILPGDRETIWPEAIDALRQSRDVMDVLRWSYDSLPESEKLVFLDITCLFYNHSVKEAFAYWEGCKKCISCGISTPHTSLRNLINKHLVQDNHSTFFSMHDLLRDLGQEIAKETKRHFVDDRNAEVAFIENQGLVTTIGLNLAESRKRKFEVKNLANMPNLHLLRLPDGCNVNGDFGRMPKRLRLLQWRSMPLAHVPMGLNLSLLTSIDFSESTKLASLWTESNVSLEGCHNLVRLNLRKCESISKLPDSIGQSSRLQYLNLMDCKKLMKLPKSMGQLQALEHLNLFGCWSLNALPDTIGGLSSLKSLDLSYCISIRALPDTIGGLSNLQYLRAVYCTSLVKLPTTIGLLPSLRKLTLQPGSGCETFSHGNIGERWTQLTNLDLDGYCGGLVSFVDYGALKCLHSLDFEDKTLTELPESIGLLNGLRILRIRCERLKRLPNSISDLNTLESLEIYCKKLQRLPNSIGNLSTLEILTIACEWLERLPNSIGDLKLLRWLELERCQNLMRLPKTLGALTNLDYLSIECCSIKKLPRSIGLLSELLQFKLKGCYKLKCLLTSIRELEGLDDFQSMSCGSIEKMGVMKALRGMPIWKNTTITKLPSSMGIISDLVVCEEEEISLFHPEYIVGTYQVLEEDESGFLRVYQDKSRGVTRLLLCYIR